MKRTQEISNSLYPIRKLPSDIDNLPREVIKWLQSLDLCYSIKNVKKDFNNGFLVAEILSRYYPVTNDQNANYKAIQMHQIDNGHSMTSRKDNWQQIQKFLEKINELTTRVTNLDTFIKNEHGEILYFIISLYQELTKRNVPLLEGKKIVTDIDKDNKSFLLKENGEIEQLKKSDLDVALEKKQGDDFQKSQKTSNSLLSKTGNVVMKGDVKPMAAQPVQAEKGFKVKISEPKLFEKSTRIMRQTREPEANILAKGPTQKKEEDLNVYNSLYQMDNRDAEQKANQIDNPFINLDEPLSKKIQMDFPDDYNKIKFTKGGKFLNNFFQSIDVLSENVIDFVMQFIIKIIKEFYNILSGKQVNDYINIFLILFQAYISLDNYEEENQFAIMHEGLITFFHKSLKNKNEEMLFIFKNVFIEKIFKTIIDKEYSTKIVNLIDMLYRILDPSNEQQVELFKMFKEKIKDEEILYESYSILHEKLSVFTDGLIDGCLFYILNGISSDNPKIRYYSLNMLLKYSMVNVNFVSNFQTKLERLSVYETDRENCLLIIKIVAQTFRNAFAKKGAVVKDNRRANNASSTGAGAGSGSGLNAEDALDNNNNNINADAQYGNRIITQIVNRFTGDHVFILLFTSGIYEYLFENHDMFKLLLSSLFKVNESILRFFFYDEDLDENMKMKYQCTIFRNPVNIGKIKNWNYAMLFKAFDSIADEQKYTVLSDSDYDFIKFAIGTGLDPSYSDVWKNSFRFSKLLIQDMNKLSKVFICCRVLEAFLLCEPIQKDVLEGWYEPLKSVFNDVINDPSEDAKKCREAIMDSFSQWIKSTKISQIVRDDLRKLYEIFPRSSASESSSLP